MNRLRVLSVVVMCACGGPAPASAVVAVALRPEAPIVTARGSSVTRTIRVSARELRDGSEVTGVTVTPECRLVAWGQRELLASTTSCSLSRTTLVTPDEVVVTISAAADAPVGQRLTSLDLRFASSTPGVASLQSGGREISITE